MPVNSPANNPMIETPLMRGLERALDLAAMRHQVLTTNLANVDTPGYHTRDLPTFTGEIERAMAGSPEDSPELVTAASMLTPTPMSREIRGLTERPDGNNVSVERESMLLAENQLRFQVAVAFLKTEFHRLSQAISGGQGS
jgi:flagellar basal-body rod protein FlgB